MKTGTPAAKRSNVEFHLKKKFSLIETHRDPNSVIPESGTHTLITGISDKASSHLGLDCLQSWWAADTCLTRSPTDRLGGCGFCLLFRICPGSVYAPNRAGCSEKDLLPHSSGNFELGCGDGDVC